MAKRSPTISERLRQIMREEDWTQEELAENMGLPFTAVRELIYGRSTDPLLSTVKTAAKNLGMSLDEFVFGKKR